MAPTLSSLPNELLHEIAQLHCTCEDCDRYGGDRDISGAAATLYSLFLVDKRFRGVFQPYLYHRVYPHGAEWEFCATVVARPDLGGIVTDLIWTSEFFLSDKDRATRATRALERSGAAAEDLGTGASKCREKLSLRTLLQSIPGGCPANGLLDDQLDIMMPRPLVIGDTPPPDIQCAHQWMESLLLDKVLTATVNVRQIRVWAVQPLKVSKDHVRSLPHLEKFALYDSMPPFDYTSVSLVSFDKVAETPPCLHSIHFEFVGTLQPPSLNESVTELVLSNSTVRRQTFNAIAKNLVNLQKLTYVSKNTVPGSVAYSVSCREIFHFLQARKDTLTDLCVKFHGFIKTLMLMQPYTEHDMLANEDNGHDDDPQSLEGINALRNIKLDLDAIADIRYGYTERMLEPRVLADMFPPSIQNVELELVWFEEQTAARIETWAQGCRETSPGLDLVVVSVPGSLSPKTRLHCAEALEMAFARSGVRFEMTVLPEDSYDSKMYVYDAEILPYKSLPPGF